MAVEVDAVDERGLRVRGGLSSVFDDPLRLPVRDGSAGKNGHIEVRVPRSRERELLLVEKALGRTHAAQPRRQLNEEPRSIGVAAFRDIPPPREYRPRAVDSGKVGEIAQLGNRRVHSVAYRDEPRGDEADAALRPRREVFDHLCAGSARFLGHVDVAHWRHDQPVLEREPVDPDGGE